MPHSPAAPLQQTAVDREAGVVEIEERHHFAHRLLVQKLGVDAVQTHGVAASREGIALTVGVIEIEHAALADHGVVVEVFSSLRELHDHLVEWDVSVQHVV